MKRPASQFYWSDWLRDPALRASSLAARGLWMDMMAMMHEGTPYGHLTVGSEIISDVKLARMAGESTGKVKKLLAELEAHGVFSRTESGAIYSRRMVRDEHIRNVRAASGKKGGNPDLVDPPTDNSLVDDLVKQNPTPSSSTSSASSSSELPDYNTALAALRDRLPEAYRPDLEAFLRSVGSIDRQASWVRSVNAALDGDVPQLSGAVSPDLIGSAIRQYSANGDRPVWIRFLGYLRNETPQQNAPLSLAKASQNRAQTDTKSEGLLLIGELRAKRYHVAAPQGSGTYVINRTELDGLNDAAKRAVQAIGGLPKIANHPDDTFSILASHFASMYTAALTNPSQDSAA